MCIFYILLPVILGLICTFLGYQLGRLSLKNTDEPGKLRYELEACRKEWENQLSLSGSLKNEIDDWRNRYSSLQSDFDAYMLKFTSAVPLPVAFDAELAASVFLKKITENDLKVVEGIGPLIEELFHNTGISTWKALAETSVEKCQQILDDAGERYRIHKPATWPKQSELAYLGKWNELKQWQDQMTGGKE